MTSTTGQSSRRIWLLLALCLLLTGTAAAQSPGPGESLMARAERVLAWLYDIPFDPPRRRQLRQAMTADWQSSPPEKNAQLDPQLTALERMMTAPPLEQEVVRQKLGLDLLEQARAQPRKQLHGFVLATHAAVHPPLAPGPPALTAQVSDGFMQLLGFAFAEVKGTPHGETPAETLEAGRKALASRWAQISTAERQKIALSPLYLAAMRFKWPKLPAAEKER